MRFKWLISVTIGLCVCAQYSVYGESIGVIKGTITYTGDVPKSSTKDDAGQQRDLLTVDRRTKGVSDVIVYLDSPASRTTKSDDEAVVIDQIEHQFVPHVIAIREGQRVRFTNSDAANHNVRATSLEERNTFNIYTGVGRDYEHAFVAARKSYPIRLSCDIHPWMTGWIFVFKHSYFDVSDGKGNFQIANIADGDYQLVIRQPEVGYIRRIDVSITDGKSSPLDLKIAYGDLKLSEKTSN